MQILRDKTDNKFLRLLNFPEYREINWIICRIHKNQMNPEISYINYYASVIPLLYFIMFWILDLLKRQLRISRYLIPLVRGALVAGLTTSRSAQNVRSPNVHPLYSRPAKNIRPHQDGHPNWWRHQQQRPAASDHPNVSGKRDTLFPCTYWITEETQAAFGSKD